MEKKVYDIGEVAEILKVNPRFVYKIVHSGELPHRKLGRLLRFTEEDINEYLEKVKSK